MTPPLFLTPALAQSIHAAQIGCYGGETGIRDGRLLESAVAMPRAGMDGRFFHGDLFAMAAALLHHLVQNHLFVDGNKRTGIAAAPVFLEINGVTIRCGNDELADFVCLLAQGDIDKDAAADFLRRHAPNAERDRNQP